MTPKKVGTSPKVAPKRTVSLVDFVMAKKRAACPVCQLPVVARGQLREASAKKIQTADQLEWLAMTHGVKISRDLFVAHRNARHEQ